MTHMQSVYCKHVVTEQVCIIDQELANAAALTRRQHFSAWNDVMAAILKLWRCIKNSTLHRCIFRAHWRNDYERCCHISYQSDLKRRSLGLFLKRSPQQDFRRNNIKNNSMMSSDMRSVPGLKTVQIIVVNQCICRPIIMQHGAANAVVTATNELLLNAIFRGRICPL